MQRSGLNWGMVMLRPGQKIGRLTLVRRSVKWLPGEGRNRSFWECVCECGTKSFATQETSLQRGSTRSCGCLRTDTLRKVHTKHGDCQNNTHTPEYKAWGAMLQRCRPGSKNHGARGISVCERWLSYENFLADVGRRPSSGYSLDRIDNEGDYEPGNVRWATSTEQMRNTRKNKSLTVNGVTKPIWQWAVETGLSPTTIRNRLKVGWDPESIVSKPSLRERTPTNTKIGPDYVKLEGHDRYADFHVEMLDGDLTIERESSNSCTTFRLSPNQWKVLREFVLLIKVT